MRQDSDAMDIFVKSVSYRVFIGLLVFLGIVVVLLVVSSHARGGDYGVTVLYNTPANGIADVTPGVDYTYKVDIVNTGDLNPGEDINLAVELDAESLAAGWTVTPSGTIIVPGVQMGVGNNVSEPVTVRAPSGAEFEESAVVNVTAVVIGHEGEVGCQDSLQLRANVVQAFGVLVTTTQDTKAADPGEMVSFEIKITNEGNGNDTFVLSATGDELGAWSVPDVTLGSGEFTFIYYNLTVDAAHDAGDILVTLTVTSEGDVTGLTYDTLGITIQVNPVYEVEIDGTPSSASIKPGEFYNFTIIARNKGTGDDTFEFYIEGTKKDWAKIYNGSTEQYQVFVPAGHTATMTLKISVP
ncbi:MAG: hypothetical protein JSW28_02365, partial [Thermoplasmata archaeon]